MSLTWIGDPVGQFLIEFVKPGLKSGESAFGSIFSIFPSWWTTWSWKRGDVEEIFDNLSFPFILFKISWLSSRAKFSVSISGNGWSHPRTVLGSSISNVISSGEFEHFSGHEIVTVLKIVSFVVWMLFYLWRHVPSAIPMEIQMSDYYTLITWL